MRLVASTISPVWSCKDGEGARSARLTEENGPCSTKRMRGCAHPRHDDAEEEVTDEELWTKRRQLSSRRRGGSSAERGDSAHLVLCEDTACDFLALLEHDTAVLVLGHRLVGGRTCGPARTWSGGRRVAGRRP